MKFSIVPFICSLLFSVFNASGQELEEPEPPSANASNVYAEFGGAGVIYSINYDGRFGKTDKGLGFRIGGGGFYADGEGYYMIPVGLNYLIGSNGNYFEMGGGASFGNLNDTFSNDSQDGDLNALGYLAFGYRRQAFKRRGVAFRSAFTPLFGRDFFIPFVSVGVGFRF